MTATASFRRSASAAGHAYTVPVVRELPLQPVAAGGAGIW